MINPETLVDAMVERLRGLKEITGAIDSSLINAYHHDFAKHTQWFRVLTSAAPGMRVRWAGTAPGNSPTGKRTFIHFFEIAIRAPESSDVNQRAIYQIWKGFVDGDTQGNGNCCDAAWLQPLTSDTYSMDYPSMRPVTDGEGQDYWMISYNIAEKGGAC